MKKKQLVELLRSEYLEKLPQWYCDMNCFREPAGFPVQFKRVADDREAFRDPDRRMAFEAVSEILGPEGTSCAWWLLELGKTQQEWVTWWKARNGAIAA